MPLPFFPCLQTPHDNSARKRAIEGELNYMFSSSHRSAALSFSLLSRKIPRKSLSSARGGFEADLSNPHIWPLGLILPPQPPFLVGGIEAELNYPQRRASAPGFFLKENPCNSVLSVKSV
jgi:hypothetical protein